jgi:hypothetical protein
MKGRVLSKPVCGFSRNHLRGRRWAMSSSAFCALASAKSRFLGVAAVVRAREY